MTMLAWFIPPLAGLAGWLAWSRLPPDPDGDDDPLECVFAVVLLSVLVTGFAGLLLAELGQLRPWSLAGSLLVLNIGLSRFPRQLRVGPRPSHRDLAAVLLLSILVAAILAPASEDLLGGRDPGVYANTAAWLAREGTVRVRSEALAALPPEARPIFHRGILFMGFYVTDAAAGKISPQFLHLFPIFMAVGHWLGGASGAFLVPPYLGTLSTLAVFFFTRRLLGLAPALVAAGTLVLNLAQIWGMRNPYSEGATQLGVFAALWCIGRAYQTGGMRWGVLGGASLGLCFLVRIDSPLLLASIAPVLAVLHASASRPQRWATHAFLPLAIVLAAWGAVHGWMFSRAYVQGPGQCIGAAVGLDTCCGGAVGCCHWSTTAHATDHALGARSGHTPLGCRRHNALRGLLRRDVGPTPHRAIPDQPQFGRPNLLRGNARADGLVCLDAGAGPCSRRGTDRTAAMGSAPWRGVAPFSCHPAALCTAVLLEAQHPSGSSLGDAPFPAGDPPGHLRCHSRRCLLPVDSGSMVAVRPCRRDRQCRSGDVARGHDERPVLAVPREERCHQPAWGSCRSRSSTQCSPVQLSRAGDTDCHTAGVRVGARRAARLSPWEHR